MAFRKSLISVLILLSAFFRLSAQEKDSQVDSLVRLLSAQSMELIEKDGCDYRRVTGPARFLHNDTYLICDTALWNVSTNLIYAISNVKILQDQTVLTSDKLTYYVDRDLAEFRGSLVQLEDKDRNILRTESLDYNTKDSVAVFFGGGSMKDKDGQVIESDTGTYDSKTKTFTFTDNVNMFTDSIFVKSTTLVYDAGISKAIFGYATDAWNGDNMLSSNAGWYDRNAEVFLFNDKVHGMSDVQEGWADSLFYYRTPGDIELLGNAQVIDTTRDVTALAGRMFYEDSLSRIKLTREPAIIGLVRTEGEEKPDSVYFGADTIISRSYMMFQVDSVQVDNAKKRIEGLSTDAVQTYRQKAAQAAAEAAAKAAEDDPNRPPVKKSDSEKGRPAGPDSPSDSDKVLPQRAGRKSVESPQEEEPVLQNAGRALSLPDSVDFNADSLEVTADSLEIAADSLGVAADSLGMKTDSLNVTADSLGLSADSLGMSADSLGIQTDSLAVELDSTKINFVWATGNVKLYKQDIQMACDSLEYNDLDSLVRLYREPVIWNELKRQYSADSLYLVLKNQRMEKASLMSDAFIIVQEDSLCYDQIRSTEMLAYFDTTSALRRFDALGDASAVFYLQEDSVYATVNKSEAKMLYATFRDGELDKVYYFETAKNDAYPLAQMSRSDRSLKGFNWQPERRPKGKWDITPLRQRVSERAYYASRPKAVFRYTDRYFPGYMPDVYDKIAKGKVAREMAKRNKSIAENVQDSTATADSLSPVLQDSLSLRREAEHITTDSLSMSRDSLALEDAVTASDSIAVSASDSTSVELSAEEKKAAAKAAKIAAREARWAQLDSLDAAKEKARADRKAAKLRKKKLKALQDIDAQDKKDNAKLERYKKVYQKRKEKEDRRAAKLAEIRAAKEDKTAENAGAAQSEDESDS
jgi:lipopolysaccharide export system protein LptA